MENFNLEIDNYTDLELEELLSLVKPYDETVIIQSKNTLKEKLLNVNNLDINRKDKLLLFLDNLTFKLLANLDRSRSLKNPFATGGFMLFKTEIFKALGGFNERDKFAFGRFLSRSFSYL